MKRHILIALICLSTGGCTLAEKTKEKINPRPTLLVNYSYCNDRGEETTGNEVA